MFFKLLCLKHQMVVNHILFSFVYLLWMIFSAKEVPIWMGEKKRKAVNVLVKDALNTFYLWIYGKGPFRLREEIYNCHGLLWLAVRDLFCAPSHSRYRCCGALVETINSSIGQPWGTDPTTHNTMKRKEGKCFI